MEDDKTKAEEVCKTQQPEEHKGMTQMENGRVKGKAGEACKTPEPECATEIKMEENGALKAA